ncbi:alpha/beta fold hydrolase [Actinospica durhamensis]|uniref:Alpha/beta fold hydrolase n=1 Tax=Actinospica durhamensis TaxID=1508375 RepID=A0A941ES26_9ACTN|nr:alpha/beta fold hydrolase [Actinospica durhamensis]MBR7836281.1 alpha/beta fold hydrolase [Actinospica durhamensis]
MTTDTQLGPLAVTVRGAGPGLLLAHGAGGGIEANYGPILDGLAAGHTVVGADYPGSGATPRFVGPLSEDELADRLVEAAVANGLETFAVSGFSLGGPIAIRIAARHPERVTALILTATFAKADARLALSARIWSEIYQDRNTLRLAEFLTLVGFSTRALDAIPAGELDAALKAFAESIPDGTPEHTELVGRIDVRGDLAGITVPTLVVVTAQDALVDPTLQRELAGAIPGAQTAEIATGHLPMAERPGAWLGLITEFLDPHE